MDRGYLGAAKLSGACEPDGKISAEFLNETPSAAPHDDTAIHSARCASHGDERATNCQTYDIPFAIEPSYRQVKRAAVAAVADTSPALIYRHSPSSGG